MKLRLASLSAVILLATSRVVAQTDAPRIAVLAFQGSSDSLQAAARALGTSMRARISTNTGVAMLPGPPLDGAQQDSIRTVLRRDTLQATVYFVGGLLTTRQDGRKELILKAVDARHDNVVAGQRLAVPTVAELNMQTDSLVAQLLRGITTARARRRG